MQKALFALLLSATAVVAFLAWPSPSAAAKEDTFMIVVSAGNPIEQLSRAELKRLATGGLKQWPNGAVVHLGIIPEDSAPETVALASLLEMTPRELFTRIQEQIFKGEMRRPAVLHSSADCVAFASAVPGALCVARAQALPAEARAVPIR